MRECGLRMDELGMTTCSPDRKGKVSGEKRERKGKKGRSKKRGERKKRTSLKVVGK